MLAIGCQLLRSVRARSRPRQQSADVFRSSTRLIVHHRRRQGQGRQADRRADRQDFIVTEDGQPQDIAFVEFQRLDDRRRCRRTLVANAPAAPAATPAPAPPQPEVASVVQTGSRPPPTGDTRYRNRRLIILFFDLSAMPPAGSDARVSTAALKYLEQQMTPADLLAIMTLRGRRGPREAGLHRRPREAAQVIDVLIYGEDKDGDGVPRLRTSAPRSARTTPSSTSSTPTGSSRRCRRRSRCCGRSRSRSRSSTSRSGLRLNGTDNNAQLRATTNAAIRANVTIYPVDARGLVALAPLGDADSAVARRHRHVHRRARAQRRSTRFQRSQDTLYALAKDTGGKAMFDYNDLSLGIVQAAQAHDQLLHHRLLQHAYRQRRQVPPRARSRWPTPG